MKKDQKGKTITNKAQTGKEIKKDMPVKNTMTDSIKNTGAQIPGLNQANITKDDLLPSDGDNLTN